MGSRMLANELMVGAERALIESAATRGWRAAEVDGRRFRRPSLVAPLRWYAGTLAIRGGEWLRGAGGRADAGRIVGDRAGMPAA
jgi:hypothetical protein